MDTVHLLKQIKSSHPNIQLIIMSTDETFDQAMDLLKQDVVHYLVKPVKSAALDLALKQARTWIAMNKKVAMYEKKYEDLRNAQSLYQQLFDEVPCYISVQDNQFVQKGGLLFQIDPSSYQLAVDQAQVDIRRMRNATLVMEHTVLRLNRLAGSEN